MKIDPAQPNHRGRTPLHVLSSLWPEAVYNFKHTSGSGPGSGHLNKTTAFDTVLSLHSDVNIADKDAVRPLHLASTFSEYLVERLLEKGADSSCVTKEGCNAIHLAARSRMPNIIGLLLTSLQHRSITTLQSSVSAKDHFGRTPLYYACNAGSYESAKLLVDAGAIVDSNHYESSPWKAVAGFEAEMKNWSGFSSDERAGAVFMTDKCRPTGQARSCRENRIDELVALLVVNDIPAVPYIDRAIADAASASADYTVECLLRARSLLQLQSDLDVCTEISASINRRRIRRNDLNKPCKKCKKMHNRSPQQRAYVLNDYHVLPEILLAERPSHFLLKTEESKAFIRQLVSMGFASILHQLTILGGLEVLDDGDWNGQKIKKISNAFCEQSKEEPLLIRACRRDISNIAVIRVLVEHARHDVNVHEHVQEQTESYYRSSFGVGSHVKGESALHALVRGEHWWHVNEGLRYFLEHGANTELRDIQGMTPLSAALHRCGWLIFNKRAVELLVQYGADVNAVDQSGKSCLAKACSDMEMTKLLLEHGAAVTNDVLIQAIDLKDADLLALFLGCGADPIVYEMAERQRRGKISREYNSPLYHVIKSEYILCKDAFDRQRYKSMTKLLLEHGANPCAKHDDTTTLHELLKEDEDISALFMAPKHGFDLEVRNASGETPLLTARHRIKRRKRECRSEIGLLILHGADIRARDNNGNNILHLFAKKNLFSYEVEDFTGIIQSTPELINQPNNEGATPLLIAAEQLHRSNIIELFLKNGGNVKAVDKKGDSMLHVLLRGMWNVCTCGKLKGQCYSAVLIYYSAVLI